MASQTPTSLFAGPLVGVAFFHPGDLMGKATTEERERPGESTRRVFERRAARRLGDEDLREMEQNLTGFFKVLGGWARAEPKSSSEPAGEVTTDHAPQPPRRGDRKPPPGRPG